jgi:hypothetical protein
MEIYLFHHRLPDMIDLQPASHEEFFKNSPQKLIANTTSHVILVGFYSKQFVYTPTDHSR